MIKTINPRNNMLHSFISLFAQTSSTSATSFDLVSLLSNGGSAAICLVMLIYFLKYIKHRDVLDKEKHAQCEATISGIVKDHKEVQSKLLRMISRELAHTDEETKR